MAYYYMKFGGRKQAFNTMIRPFLTWRQKNWVSVEVNLAKKKSVCESTRTVKKRSGPEGDTCAIWGSRLEQGTTGFPNVFSILRPSKQGYTTNGEPRSCPHASPRRQD
eukprot:EG_transcript_39622